MIEQAIYFAIGCILTALLALLFTPVLWSRAMRLSRKRLQLQVPLSMQEILAERDQLRAAHAVERLRIEQEMTRVRAGKDGDMVAIGRYSIEAARLAEEVEALRKLGEAQAHEIKLLSEAGAAHEIARSGLRKELAATHADVASLREAAEVAAREHARLAEEGEGHRTSAAALVARVSGYDEAQATIRRLDAELLQMSAYRDAERERQKERDLGASLQRGRDRAAGREVAERLESLERDNIALRQALKALETSGPSTGSDDASLRESIHALGLAVATMGRDGSRSNGKPEPSVEAPGAE